VINCDVLGHRAYARGTKCYDQVVARFGQGVVDPATQEINRRALGPVVFSDPDAMAALNGIVWPSIRQMATDAIAAAPATAPAVVIEAALLVETGLAQICSEVWVIATETEDAIRRVMARDAVDRDMATKRVSAQPLHHTRVAAVQSLGIPCQVLHTAGPLHDNLVQIDALWEQFLSRCGQQG
jgi:dephospho-CoA kinase